MVNIPSPQSTTTDTSESLLITNIAQLANRAMDYTLTEEENNCWIEQSNLIPTHKMLFDEDILENFNNIEKLYEGHDETNHWNEISNESYDEAEPTPSDISECCKTLFRLFATQHDFKDDVFKPLVVIDDYVKYICVKNA